MTSVPVTLRCPGDAITKQNENNRKTNKQSENKHSTGLRVQSRIILPELLHHPHSCAIHFH